MPEVGTTPVPRAAWAARMSSGAVGSPSRRRFPNTMNAIIIVTPPVVTTAVGIAAARIATTLGVCAERVGLGTRAGLAAARTRSAAGAA